MSILGIFLGKIMAKELNSLSPVSEGLLKRILGPAADELGVMLQDKVRAYRNKNLAKIVPRALDIIESSKLEVQEIPLRTLIPLLERASVEDDDYLSEKWAQLFASAATSKYSTDNHPCFPQVLSELSPLDALILDRLWEPERPKSWFEFRDQQKAKYDLDEKLLNMTFASLDRNGLCLNTNEYKFTELGIAFMKAVTGKSNT